MARSIEIVTLTVTPVQLLAANGQRRAYSVINRGAADIYVGGSDVTSAGANGLTVQQGEQVGAEGDTDEVWAAASAGSQRIEVVEIT